MLNRLLLFLLFASVLSFAIQAQSIRMSITGATMKRPGNLALLVSNQYGVLRYYKPLNEEDAKGEGLSFEVNQRLGERLSLTLVREISGGGIFGFSNTTYCNLADGVVIDAPAAEAAQNFEMVSLTVKGVSGVEDIVVLSPLVGDVEYRVDRQQLFVSFNALASADLFVLFRINGSEDYLSYYRQMGKDNRIVLDITDLNSGLIAHEISLPSVQFWDGSLKGWHGGSDKPCYLFHGSQMKTVSPRNSITAYLPPGLEWKHFDLELSNLGSDRYAFYNRYFDSLPSALGTVDFNPLLADHQSKAFRFQTSEDELGQFYAVTYAYSLANQMPANWQVFGLVEQAGAVDFILPDLPDELLNALPELQVLPEPAAITKSLFRCARCEGYDFRLAPAQLEKEDWRLEKGIVERAQLLEF